MKRLYYGYDFEFKQQKIIASSMQDAKNQFLKRGIIIFRLKTGRRISTHSFSINELLIITRQLATMLKAGLPIVDSLQLITTAQMKPHWQYLLEGIKQQITKGESLSQALTQYEFAFPALYKEVIATGELTGQLDLSFEQLAGQLEQSLLLQKRLKKALAYPVFLLIVAIIVTFVMLLLVLPQFASVYDDFDAELPYFTKCLLNFSAQLQNHFSEIAISITLFSLFFKLHLKKRYRSLIDLWLLKLPVLGQIIKSSNLMQIFITLAVTQKSGIPLLNGLLAATNTAYNSQYQQTLIKIKDLIEQGNAFSYALKQYTLFPYLCAQLTHIGEESGTLDLMLEKLANFYQDQNMELTDKLSHYFEPLLMLVLAVVIGGLIIAIYLPIFQLGNVIH